MRGVFDIENLSKKLEELEKQSETLDWQDNEKSGRVMQEKSRVESTLNDYNSLKQNLKDNVELLEIAEAENDSAIISEIEKSLQELQSKVNKSKVESLFSGDADKNDCFIEINAGAGGSDACDFASMLLRMYLRWAERHGFKAELVHCLDGEEAGIKSATIKITGHNAFGWAKTESGVHRLVRISPFNANGKRQTGFASIWVYPIVDDDINIEVLEKDLRIDTFRASGAGGQHVNKTDSAVRFTHLPTGIVVQCQSDRSQIRNRAEAMKMLKSRLYEAEIRKREEEQSKINAGKTDNSWGHQIRSYVMHPYHMVKDLRTGYEVGNYQSVLDGDLDGFIMATLSQKISNTEN
ncbi:MAG: prfB [Rickettsiaceae bacterium]|nr:prfB [Rickettsiaceae bacterium]